ncbi:MAG: nucleotidyltransferase domain-containing protein [Candidatus Marinimicrobia bacterium]|nr:nucleotidyltransferase domain-containing protein [Candidatus Neomarinimicrobiota bacterium]
MNEQSKKRLKMAEQLSRSLQGELGRNLISLVVFGSTARGTAEKESDIDILLIVENEKEAREKYLEIKLKLEKAYSPQFYSIISTEAKLRDNPYILLDMIDDSVVLYDPEKRFQNLISHLRKKLKALGAKRIWIDNDTWYWDLKPDWKPGEVVEVRL